MSASNPFTSADIDGPRLIRQPTRPVSRGRVLTSRDSQYVSSRPRGIKKVKHPRRAASMRIVQDVSHKTSSNEYIDVQHRVILERNTEIDEAKQQLEAKDFQIEKQKQKINGMSEDIEKLDTSLAFLAKLYEESQGTIVVKDEHLTKLEKSESSLKDSVKQLEASGIKNEKTKVALDAKLKRLGASIKGLCNDHNGLRDNARQMASHRDELNCEKQSIQHTLTTIQAAHEANEAKARQIISGYREHIETLNQTVVALRQELGNRPADLETEPEKNEHLETELTRLVASHDRFRNENSQGHHQVSNYLILAHMLY